MERGVIITNPNPNANPKPYAVSETVAFGSAVVVATGPERHLHARTDMIVEEFSMIGIAMMMMVPSQPHEKATAVQRARHPSGGRPSASRCRSAR